MSKKIVYSTVVGSYPQPNWLVNRELLKKRVPFRVLSEQYWKVDKSKIQNVQFINSNIEINFIDYYFTNHIARSSMTMNECRSIKKKLMSTELKG